MLEATILFAKQGYAAVSMKQIAQAVGIKSASLYNHFSSKEELWNTSLEHATALYKLYFSRLDEMKHQTTTFEEVLEAMFAELKDVVNIFTYYAFSLVQTEQFREEQAGSIFTDLFLKFSIDYIATWFDDCVARGLTAPFATRTVARLFMHTVLIANNLRVQENMGRDVPYDISGMFNELQAFILQTVGRPPA